MYRILVAALVLAGCQTSPTPAPRDGATYADPKPVIPPGSLTDKGDGSPVVGGYVEGSAGVYRVR